jgi:hypothetical protein
MALFEAEFIDAYHFDSFKRDFAIEELQPFLMDVFDQVPAHSKILGDRPDRAEPKHVEHCQGKGSNKAVGSRHERKSRPPQRRAHSALQTVESKIEDAFLPSDRTHVKPPVFAPLEAGVPATAPRASDPLIVHLGTENNGVGKVMSRLVLNTLQPISVVKYRCGHGWNLLRIVRLVSNNTESAMSIFCFQLSGYAFAGRPQISGKLFIRTLT